MRHSFGKWSRKRWTGSIPALNGSTRRRVFPKGPFLPGKTEALSPGPMRRCVSRRRSRYRWNICSPAQNSRTNRQTPLSMPSAKRSPSLTKPMYRYFLPPYRLWLSAISKNSAALRNHPGIYISNLAAAGRSALFVRPNFSADMHRRLPQTARAAGGVMKDTL